MPRRKPSPSRHRHNHPVVECPYCGTTGTRVTNSRASLWPVRYHVCDNGHNFKSVEVRVVGVVIAEDGARQVKVSTVRETPAKTHSPASKLAGV